jgi:hypothetical protein
MEKYSMRAASMPRHVDSSTAAFKSLGTARFHEFDIREYLFHNAHKIGENYFTP